MAIKTSNIELTTGEQAFQAYLAEPESGGPGILLLHAWWGLKPFFKQTADRLAQQGFVVLAPDLREGRIAKTVEEAQQMLDQSDSQLTGDKVMAAKDYLLNLPTTKGQKISVIGFSMGAAWAMIAAAYDPAHVAAVALFYGAAEVDFSKLQASVLGHFSNVDEWEPYDGIQSIEQKMKEAGISVKFHTYPGLAHWFVEEDRPEFNREAASLAWDRTIQFLREKSPASS